MKVQTVKIKEFKCLHDFEANMDGGVILIKGENGLGKSTIIQFIEIALGKNTTIPPHAQGEGEVIVDKNGATYTFRVEFKDGKPKLTVTTPDGLKDSRKGTIQQLVGAIDFDIDAFVEMSKSEKGRKQQVEIFKSFLPKEVQDDLNRYEAHVRQAYEERTEVNRQIKEIDGFVKNHPLYNFSHNLDQFPHVNVDAVYEQLKAAQKTNTQIAEVKTRKEERAKELEKLAAQMEEIKKQVEALMDQQKKASEWLKNTSEVDVTEFENQIKSATETNQKHQQAQSLKQKIALQKELVESAGDLTAKIESSRYAIQDTIRQMDTPIEGLSYDNEELVYGGVPVNPDSLSTSEIMQLGILLKTVENPEAPLFIQRTESIGQKRWEAIIKFAEENGMQIIGEEVVRGKEELTVEIVKA